MTPRIALTNLGIDTNVFNEAADQNPKRDFTATVTPTTDIWLRMGRSWLRVNIKEDLVWFQKYASERSANNSYTIDWRMRLNRLKVDLSPTYVNTRDRPGYEIDARSQRRQYGGKGMVEIRGLSKTFFGLTGSWQRIDFDSAVVFDDTNLREALNRTEASAGFSIRHQLTPLTTISVSASRQEDRFEFSPQRDSNSTAAAFSVSFDPVALIKGGASVGYRDFHPLSPGVPGYNGLTATGDLSYALLGMMRFAVQFKRDVSYSYQINEPYYLETGVSGSVAQQIFGPVDAVVRGGIAHLTYREREDVALPQFQRIDSIRSYGGGLGYHMGRDARLSLNVDAVRRISTTDARRRYSGLRYGTAVTYGF